MRYVSTRPSRPPLSLWVVYVSTVIFLFSVAPPGACAEQDWPSFRGASASGVADGYSTPVRWDLKRGTNIRWKTPIPGLGHSSPAVWGDRIFVTTAVQAGHESTLKVGLYGDVKSAEERGAFDWLIYCINRKDGKVIWSQTAHTGKPRVKRHPKSTHANSTPCTDGSSVVVFFGSEGLYCYDMEGGLKWKKDLGVLDWGFFRSPAAQWGGGTSPIIHNDMVIIQCDVQKDSFIAAYSLQDGTLLWKTARDDVPTWGTPTAYAGGEHSQIIVNGFKHIGGYDVATGKEIWRMTGGGDIPVPTPVVGGNLVFITNAHGGKSPVYAVRLSAAGDISLSQGQTSNEHVVWSYDKGGNYMTTPIAYRGYLYCCSDRGSLSCFEAATGKMMYRESLASSSTACSASPVAAEGQIYCTSENGDIYVVQAGPEFRLTGVNQMNEICMATPAISDGALFFRTRNHLICVADDSL